ncbi:hypothetical protein BST81_07595 [Leptolyngbya sp. 'hensonii']|uniref:hypothetical protein n=1 Tax=Leptolyngbya sp. 'hensonii' TaxID=1922337 RepID=UPI00094FE7DF|nr:hypothetical protein [Leptolyngbya sp. 'hensonii']OLP19068.1 hypothetical protein BST81_07595 [Leptolyngbya sp. 'hensonii']
MVNPANDIARQARQGSVAAIIQVLNDQLSDQGVRTRAVFSDRVLQLLCEAATTDQLEQVLLVDRVKQILESISPRHVHRVNINSRIVREQQLLWLDEINRDPESQLLWSQEITLAKPNILSRFLQERKAQRSGYSRSALPRPLPSRPFREQRQFWRGMLGGAGLSFLALAAAFGLWHLSGMRSGSETQPNTALNPAPSPAESPVSPEGTSHPAVAKPVSQIKSVVPARKDDPFVEAVRLAEQASQEGKQAQTSVEWLQLAAKWQRASDLMGQVSPKDDRYKTAQSRRQFYRQNSESALQEAEKKQATISE